MNTIKDFKDYSGPDMDLETSLFEYGLICKHTTKDYPDEYHVIAKVGVNLDTFDSGWIRESELDDLMHGRDWMDQKDITNVLNFVGMDIKDWLELFFINKLSDLVSYFGIENFIGPSYGSFQITQDE